MPTAEATPIRTRCFTRCVAHRRIISGQRARARSRRLGTRRRFLRRFVSHFRGRLYCTTATVLPSKPCCDHSRNRSSSKLIVGRVARARWPRQIANLRSSQHAFWALRLASSICRRVRVLKVHSAIRLHLERNRTALGVETIAQGPVRAEHRLLARHPRQRGAGDPSRLGSELRHALCNNPKRHCVSLHMYMDQARAVSVVFLSPRALVGRSSRDTGSTKTQEALA